MAHDQEIEMKMLMKWLAAIAVAFTLIGAVGCSSTSTRESTGQYVDDSSITTKVKTKFVEDKTVSAMRIHVETFQGVVQLSGFANSDAERNRAIELARSVPGVKDVKDDIQVKNS